MKKVFILSALISVTIFTSCNKQEMEDDFVPASPELPSLVTHINTDNHDISKATVGKANFTINNENNEVHEKEALLLTNNSTNAVSYLWDFGNGNTSTEADPSYKYELHGNYTVTLTITDVYGNMHQESHEILVLCVFGGGPHDQ